MSQERHARRAEWTFEDSGRVRRLMRQKAVVSLAIGAVWATAQATIAPTANADRPVSDITCASGKPATYGHGQHRFRDRAVVLGCTPLADGGRLQLEASHRDYSAATCIFLTGAPPTQNVYANVYACPERFRAAPRVVLILRHRGPRPILVMGITPAGSRRLVVRYSTDGGARKQAHADLIRVGGKLAAIVGAPGAFAVFVAELGRDVDVCLGTKPRAINRTGVPMAGELAVPGRHAFARPGGWLAGFTGGAYGIGLSSGSPEVCVRSSPADALEGESRSARQQVEPHSLLERLAELLRSAFPWQ
jgi:hypothetical protein